MSARTNAALALALVALATAPTPGDIGGCGQAADDLDAPRFYATRAAETCDGCTRCGLSTSACVAACARRGVATAFPAGCRPLVHDGEVCLDKLQSGNCGEWSRWAADTGATEPTECQFCP